MAQGHPPPEKPDYKNVTANINKRQFKKWRFLAHFPYLRTTSKAQHAPRRPYHIPWSIQTFSRACAHVRFPRVYLKINLLS
jgi:hypothetical protein